MKYLKVDEKEIKNNIDYYIENFEQLKKVNTAIDNSKKGKFYNLKPEKVYKKVFPSSTLILPEKWEELFKLNYEKFEIHLIYVSTEIEKLKYNYSSFDKYRNYDYYDKIIDYDNYIQYKENYDKNVLNYNKLENIKTDIKYIENNSSHINAQYPDLKEEIEKFRNLKLNYEFELEIIEYNNKFTKIKDEILLKIKEKKEKEKERRKERERERRREKELNENYNNYTNYNNYSSSNNFSSSYSNDDNKKVYLKLCQDCKNKCIGCRRKIEGGVGCSKGFGNHKKCQISSCLICGKSNSTVRERDSTYLCKPCYHSNKFDVSKCIDCHKSFK